jgi:ribose 5-phosphate isomerase B
MKVFLGADHAGFEMKEKIRLFLIKSGYEVVDCGAEAFNANDDYPDFIGKAADGVSKNPGSMGVVIGGSGQGEAMVANKYRGVRCALFYAPIAPSGSVDVLGKMSRDKYEMLKLAREHNDANMISLSGRFLKEYEAIKAVEIFFETGFHNEERHVRRIEKIKEIESKLKIQNFK